MGSRGTALVWTAAILFSCLTRPLLAGGVAQQQQPLPFVPEFPLACHPTEPVKDVPREESGASPLENGPWYISEDRAVWALWQQMVSGEEGNRVMWIKPSGFELLITGRRLDGDARPLRVDRNRSFLDKGFEPIRLYFEESGCWEVTATSGKSELVFVVEIETRNEQH